MNAFETWFKKCGFKFHGGIKECAAQLDVSRRYVEMLITGHRMAKGRQHAVLPKDKLWRRMAEIERKLEEGERV